MIQNKDKSSAAAYLMDDSPAYSIAYDSGQEILPEVFAAWFSGVDNKLANKLMDRLLELRGR